MSEIENTQQEKIFLTTYLAIAYLDRELNFIRVNNSFANRENKPPEYYSGKKYSDVWSNEDPGILFNVLETGEQYVSSTKPFHSDDYLERGISYWDWSVQRISNSNGEIEGLLLCLQDVSQRVHAIEALRESEQKFRSIVEHSHDGIVLTDEKGLVIGWNQAMVEISGIEWQYALGKKLHKVMLQIVPEELRSNSKYYNTRIDPNLYSEGSASEWSSLISEFEIQRPDGKRRMIQQSSFIIETEVGYKIGAINRDVTEIKQSEISLKRSRKKYQELYELLRTVTDNVRDIIWAKDNDEKYIFTNQAMCDKVLMCGSPDQALGKSDTFFSEIARQKGFKYTYGNTNSHQENELHDIRETNQYIEEGFIGDDRLVLDVIRTPFLDDNNCIIGTVGSGRDITKQKQIEDSLRANEEKFRSIVEQSYDGIVITSKDGKIIEWNNAQTRITGLKTQEVLGRYIWDIPLKSVFHRQGDPGKHSKTILQILKRIFQNDTFVWDNNSYEYWIERRDGVQRTVSVTIFPINTETDEMIGAISKDITAREEAERALRESQQRLELALRGANIGLWEYDLKDDTMRFDPGWTDKFHSKQRKYTPDNVSWEKITHPDDIQRLKRRINAYLKSKKNFFEEEIRVMIEPGKWQWMLIRGKTVTFDDDGSPRRLAGTSLDISDRKAAEENVKTSLLEKEVMLKEIHHRVKGNLQVISSLLDLQSKSIEDEKALELFIESRNRIKTMALIHEKLYMSDNLSEINFGDYIKALTESLLLSFGFDKKAIRLDINIDNLIFDVGIAIPCALIINELISNSLRHAFKAKINNELKVELNLTSNNTYSLRIIDNGIGLPEGFEYLKTDTLGMQLIISLTDQLHGEIQFINNNGTEVRIDFPVPKNYKEEVD
jgi:PAS domain S-box-containing protein